jgi:hypothetical protein
MTPCLPPCTGLETRPTGIGARLAARLTLLGTLSIAITAMQACREDPLIDSINITPLANAGEDRPVAIMAPSVEVSLDGSGSIDSDGRIEAWRWFAATADPDGGAGVVLPDGVDPAWPDDVESPVVELTEGVWTFSLWVIDDAGSVSTPDTVTITVGTADPLADPRVAACAQDVLASVAPPCKACVCGVSADCRANIVESACNQDCWDLIACIDVMCPDFAQTMDSSCVIANCSELLGAAIAAMSAGPCVIQCADVCN